MEYSILQAGHVDLFFALMSVSLQATFTSVAVVCIQFCHKCGQILQLMVHKKGYLIHDW